MSQKGILTGGRALTKWLRDDATQGTLIQRLINAVNTLADNTASSAVGRYPPPTPIQGLNVSVGGEYAHVTIQHSGPVSKGVHYFVEVANDPSFVNAHPIAYGASRTRDPIHMAPFDANGDPQSWYVRGFSQYPGSDPSPPVVYGGASPTAITTTGATQLSWLPSTGSGTASSNGSQPGWGFGKTQKRD